MVQYDSLFPLYWATDVTGMVVFGVGGRQTEKE